MRLFFFILSIYTAFADEYSCGRLDFPRARARTLLKQPVGRLARRDVASVATPGLEPKDSSFQCERFNASVVMVLPPIHIYISTKWKETALWDQEGFSLSNLFCSIWVFPFCNGPQISSSFVLVPHVSVFANAFRIRKKVWMKR